MRGTLLKSSFAAGFLAAITLLNGSLFGQVGRNEAGRYWVDIERNSATSYTILLGIEAAEPLEVYFREIPNFIDRSILEQRILVMPLLSREIRYPIEFLRPGSGRLEIVISSQTRNGLQSYLMFELFNGAGIQEIQESLEEVANAWKAYGRASAVVVCGKAAVACGGSLAADIFGAGLLVPDEVVCGVLLKGCAESLTGEATGIDPVEWGLKYSKDVAGRVGSFVNLRAAHVSEQPAREEKPAEEEEAPAEEAEWPREETAQTAYEPEPEPEMEPEPEQTIQPGTTPVSGKSTGGGIAAFAADWWWSKERQQDGRFGETLVEMPDDFFQLTELQKAELIISAAYSQQAGSAGARVFISDRQSIEPKDSDHHKGTCWYGDLRSGREKFLSDFSVTSQGREFRFEITGWIRSNPSDKYYVIVENLDRADIGVGSVRIEFSGQK
jgi:hypothetical protein